MARHDIFVELATDQVNQVQELLDEDRYREVHEWLWPIFYKILKQELAELSDDDLEAHYADQLGVDIPSSPPLSSDDEETEEELVEACFGKASTQETPNGGSVSCTPPVEHGPLPGLHPQCNAEGMAKVATAIRRPSCSETPLQGTECTSKVRVPVCVLFGLVHGQGS